jgi:hypothetical protein
LRGMASFGTAKSFLASYLIQRPFLYSPSKMILLGLSVLCVVNSPHELGKYFWNFDLGKDLIMWIFGK